MSFYLRVVCPAEYTGGFLFSEAFFLVVEVV